MKTYSKILILLSVIFSSLALSAPIDGKWLSKNGMNQFNITKVSDSEWQGVLVASEKKNAPLGQVILSSVQKIDDGYKGTVHAVKAAKDFDAIIHPIDDTLVITIKAGFFNKEVIWVRIK